MPLGVDFEERSGGDIYVKDATKRTSPGERLRKRLNPPSNPSSLPLSLSLSLSYIYICIYIYIYTYTGTFAA